VNPQTKKSASVLWLVLGLLALCLIVSMLLLVYAYGAQRHRAISERPLVLIHAPLHRERVLLGQGGLAHATARAEGGVARMELWVDGTLVAIQESLQGSAPILVLSSAWEAETLGAHVLLVRAVSASGVSGQATVAVEAVEGEAAEGPPLESHIVQPWDTLESLLVESGATLEEVLALNPGLDPTEPLQSGDVLVLPGEEPVEGLPEEESPPPTPSDEVPPAPHDVAPGSLWDMLELLFGGFRLFERGDDEPTPLRVELLALTTDAAIESLHCYIGAGDALAPRWYPDADSDPLTDESFAPLGENGWDVAAHMAGERAFRFDWPADQPFTAQVTCVGGAGGGADALDLGQLDLAVRPEAWDGLARRAVGEGTEGRFTLEYRISRAEASGRGHPIFLDPSMTPPTNLRLDTRRYVLRWDYHPLPDEEPIDGFRVYLNDTLQWIEEPEARDSGLPPEWLAPPCGEAYAFTVTAFRYGFPDGPESRPSNELTASTDPDECQRAVIVTFGTLETRDLGGDGERDPGDVGPVYGGFYVGEQGVTFDGRCDGPGICGVFALDHDSEYDINGITSYFGDGPAQFFVELPFGEDLLLGYTIWDEDTGYRNADDRVCEGWTHIASEDMDRPLTTGLESDDRRCRVTFTVSPVFGSPLAEAGSEPPRPMLIVEDLTVEPRSGQLQIHVRNIGAASWPEHELQIAVTWPSGAGIGAYSWPDFFLAPGDAAILQHPDLTPHPPLGACILLDPGNQVLEEDDRQVCDETTGDCMYIWRRGRYCRPLADLTITDVGYDSAGERLLVVVENRGEGSVEHANLGLRVNLPDGRYFAAPAEWWSDVSLDRYDAVILEWPNIGPEQRALMLDGYTVTVDPNNDIAETVGSNNEYTVGGSTRLWVSWTWIEAPYDVRNSVEYSLQVYLSSGGSRRSVADWHIRQDIDWGSCFNPYYCVRHFTEDEYDTYWFDVAGDEELEIRGAMSHPGTLRGAVDSAETYSPQENWGAGGLGPYRTCSYLGPGDNPGEHIWIFDYDDEGERWSITFNVCQEEEP